LGDVPVPPGTGVLPLGVVVEVAGGVVLVGSVSFSVAGLGLVPALPESLESSPATMISAMPTPITKQINRPPIQRARVFTLRL
jgi:hypothetical protein